MGVIHVRFDDRLKTVLSAGHLPGLGAQATWRQLVDLMGRERYADEAALIACLRTLRDQVPPAVRIASARGLASAWPSAALVGLFGEDEAAVAAPLLREVRLPAAGWLAILPQLTPAARGILRMRRDLPAKVLRGLDSLGSVDRVLAAPIAMDDRVTAPEVPPAAVEQDTVPGPVPPASPSPASDPATGFSIPELIARIDAYRHGWSAQFHDPPPAGTGGFRFVTDPDGIIRWVDGVARAALRRRARFSDVRLEVEGMSDAAGAWRIDAQPRFDPATGRFIGYGGTGQRPARREAAAPSRTAMSDGLRQLVHELRTPANAVIGFAELIEAQLLGPVPDPYRQRAHVIRVQADGLLTAIDDLDVAARIEGGALDLRPIELPLGALIQRAVADLAPMAQARGVTLAMSGDAVAVVDDRAADRLVARLLAALVGAATAGERIEIAIRTTGRHVAVTGTRPRAIADMPGEPLFTLDREADTTGGTSHPDEHDGPLLGVRFTLRLVRNLAAELGGELSIDRDHLTLLLPAATRPVTMATTLDW